MLRGFTLVELMLALLLGSLISGAALHAFSAGWRALQWQVALLRMEESGRYALGVLARELRMAGFYAGSVQPLPPPPAGAPACGTAAAWPLQMLPSITLLNDVAADVPVDAEGAALGCLPLAALVHDSDVLGIKRAAARPAGDPDPLMAALPALPARDGYWHLGYTDPDTPLRWGLGGSLPSSSATPATQWWEWRVNLFFVRDYAVTRGDGIPSLCSARLRPAGMRTECLVDGVELLHLSFGTDSDGDGSADRWLESPTAADLRTAVEARIYLLLRSVDPLPQVPPQSGYLLGGKSVTRGDDGYLRRVVSTTVPLLGRLGA